MQKNHVVLNFKLSKAWLIRPAACLRLLQVVVLTGCLVHHAAHTAALVVAVELGLFQVDPGVRAFCQGEVGQLALLNLKPNFNLAFSHLFLPCL